VKIASPKENDAPVSPPARYYDTYNKELYRTESTRALNAHNEAELDYMPPSSPNEEFGQGVLSGGRRQQPLNVVSINDPFGKESVSFSMISPKNTNNNTLSYASAVDYYGVNSGNRNNHLPVSPSSPPPPFTSPTLDLRSTTASPPPNQDLPPVPASVSSIQSHHYYHAV
jgi:hypothetical protein